MAAVVPNPRSFESVIDEYLLARGVTRAHMAEVHGCSTMQQSALAELSDKGAQFAYHFMGAWRMPGRGPDGALRRDAHLLLVKRSGEIQKMSTSGVNKPRPVFLRHPDGWGDLTGQVIYIAESYIKGVVLAQVTGEHVVVLGGVDLWSSGRGVPSPELSHRCFEGAVIVPVFDSLNESNPASKKNVLRAWNDVAGIMLTRFPSITVRRVWLPSLPEGDQGVDDFVVRHGRKALLDLLAGAEDVPPEELNSVDARLAHYNEHYAMLKSPATFVIELGKPEFIMPAATWKVLNSNDVIRAVAEGPRGGTERMRAIPVADLWVKWPQRNTLDGICWRPGGDVIVDKKVNLWTGFSCAPARGSGDAEKYWLATAKEMFPEDWRLFVDLMAAMVQKPEHNPGRYVFIHGINGTGKGFIMKPFVAMLGKHVWNNCTVEAYNSRFNFEARDKRLIIMTELPARLHGPAHDQMLVNLKQESDNGAQIRRVEPKHGEVISIERLALLVIMSNFDTPWEVQGGERRGLYLRAESALAMKGSPGGTKNVAWWAERHQWADSPDAGPELMRFLLDWKVDYKQFYGLPPVTDYKQQEIEHYAESTWVGFREKLYYQGLPGLEPPVAYASANQLLLLRDGAGADQGLDSDRIIRSIGSQLRGAHVVRIGTRFVRALRLGPSKLSPDKIRKEIERIDAYLNTRKG